MSRISTTGPRPGAGRLGPRRGSWCRCVIGSSSSGPSGPARGRYAGTRGGRTRLRAERVPAGAVSTCAVGQDLGGLLLGEGRLLGDDPLGDLLAGDDLLGEVHQLGAEQRVALDDEVDLALGERRHAVLDRRRR